MSSEPKLTNFERTFPNFERTFPNFGWTFPNFERTFRNFGWTFPNFERTFANFERTFRNFGWTFPNFEQTFANFERTFRNFEWTFPNVDRQFPNVHRKFVNVDRKFVNVDRKFVNVDRQFVKVGRQFSNVHRKFASFNSKFTRFGRTFTTFDTKRRKLHAPPICLGVRFARGPPGRRHRTRRVTSIDKRQTLRRKRQRKTIMAINTDALPSPHADAARALLEKIRALRADVPRFVHELREETRKLLQASTVPDGFLESAGVSVQTFTRLEQASGTDAPTLRDAFSFALAYDPVVQEARAFARAVAYTIRVQRAEAGASALDIYAVAQRLSKRKDGAELRPYVEDMKRKLAKHKRSRKTTSEPVPAPDDPSAPSETV